MYVLYARYYVIEDLQAYEYSGNQQLAGVKSTHGD